jgi:quaternary ammonium compound-resistance protein SugE
MYLLAAGLFEVGFTTSMRFAKDGNRLAQAAFVVCVVLSFWLLTEAIKTVPLGIAYAVWTGIGAAGTLLLSVLVFREPINPIQIGFVMLLILSIIGLKYFSADSVH